MSDLQVEVAHAADLFGRDHRKVQHSLPLLIPDQAGANGTAECMEALHPCFHLDATAGPARADASAGEHEFPGG